MVIEPALFRSLSVLGLPPPAEGDENGGGPFGPLADPTGEVVPRHPRHSEIQQDHVRLEGIQYLQRFLTRHHATYLMPQNSQQESQALGGIAVVVDDQYAAKTFWWRGRRRL